MDIIVCQKTDLGFKVIVDEKFYGMLFDKDVFKPLRKGDRMKAYIKQVRPDDKIDVVLQNESGRELVEGFAERLLQELFASEGGCLPYHDKTDADEIYRAFGVSKKTFKRAVGDLYKRNLITLSDSGIELRKKV